MGARDGVDAVQLHEPQPLDQRQKIITFGHANRLFGQGVAIQKQVPRRFVVQLLNLQGSAPFQGVAKRYGRGQDNCPVRSGRRIVHF